MYTVYYSIHTYIYITLSLLEACRHISLFKWWGPCGLSRSRLSWKSPLAPMTTTYHWRSSRRSRARGVDGLLMDFCWTNPLQLLRDVWHQVFRCWQGSVFLVLFLQVCSLEELFYLFNIIKLCTLLNHLFPWFGNGYFPKECLILQGNSILFQQECCICKGLHFGKKVHILDRLVHLPQGGFTFWRKTRPSTHSSRNT